MKFIVVLETSDNVTADDLHENLCKVLHEGYCHDDAEIPVPGCIQNIQVVGEIDDPVSEEDATDEQRAAVEGAVEFDETKVN